MDFALPQDLVDYLAELDAFIEAEIKPLEQADDNIRFFDHRREHARTDWDNQGLPRQEWEALLAEARRAGRRRRPPALRLAGGVGRQGRHQPRHGGDPRAPGRQGPRPAQRPADRAFDRRQQPLHHHVQGVRHQRPVRALWRGPAEGRDPLRLRPDRAATTAPTPPSWRPAPCARTRDGVAGWRINGEKMWTTGMHVATHIMCFARTSGKDGDAAGITVFLVPADAPGVKIEEYLWTFNMPTDHPRVSLTNVWVPDEAIWGVEGRGLGLGQSFVHQNRIRQAASSLGAAVFCVEESVKYARMRKPFGKPLSRQPGDPVAAGRARHPVRDAAPADPQDRLGDGPHGAQGGRAADLRQGLDVQLLGQPPGLRGRRPGHAGARRHRLFAAQAVRAHLPSPPPLSDHRGLARRSRCARWRPSCSATSARAGRNSPN